MSNKVLELEVKAKVSGAASEFKDLNSTVKESITEVEELNQQLEIQTEVVNDLETSLLKMKQQQSVNSDYQNSVSGLTQKIKETTVELQLEKQAMKGLKAERTNAIQSSKALEKAQKDQTRAIFGGIKHYRIMGVSLSRIGKISKSIVPGFKLLFSTIKMGIASTGIGIIVLAIASLGTAMARTGKGAAAFKAILGGIKEVVNFLLKPLELAGDAMIDLFGVEASPALTDAEKLKNELSAIDGVLEQINLRRKDDEVQLYKNKEIVGDTTKSEKERLAAAEDSYNKTKQSDAETIAQLQEKEKLLHKERADYYSWYKFEKSEDGRIAESMEAWKKAKEEHIALQNELKDLINKTAIDDIKYEGEIKYIKEFNTDKQKENDKDLADKQKKWREERIAGEKKVAEIILQLKNEAEVEALTDEEEIEKKKLEQDMLKQKKEIENSKASKKSKDEALKLLDKDYQQDLLDIEKEYQDEKDEQAEKTLKN